MAALCLTCHALFLRLALGSLFDSHPTARGHTSPTYEKKRVEAGS